MSEHPSDQSDAAPEAPLPGRPGRRGREHPSDQLGAAPEAPEEGESTPPIEGPEPEPQGATVEALMGFRDFLAVAPGRPSAATTSAAQAALRRWMRLSGHDIDGFYTMAQWQSFYADTMRHT
jgi:hypothetical protein